MDDDDTERFGFARYLTAVAAVIGVDDGRTFHSRLQQLQKASIPHGSNTGRGSKPGYTVLQALETVVALDLLDIGLVPAGIVSLMEGGLLEVLRRPVQAETVGVRLGGLDPYRAMPGGLVTDDPGAEPGPVAIVRPASRLRQLERMFRQ